MQSMDPIIMQSVESIRFCLLSYWFPVSRVASSLALYATFYHPVFSAFPFTPPPFSLKLFLSHPDQTLTCYFVTLLFLVCHNPESGEVLFVPLVIIFILEERSCSTTLHGPQILSTFLKFPEYWEYRSVPNNVYDMCS